MPHYADPKFWHFYRALPESVRALADKNFQLLLRSSEHPSLRFKKVNGRDGLWSARVGRDYRALAVEVEGGLLWIWIGTHAEYERVIASYK